MSTESLTIEALAASLIGRTIRFAAIPYESGTIQVTECEPVNDYSVRVVGIVIEGKVTSRLFGHVSHRSIAGQRVELYSCGRYDIEINNFARYDCPV